MKFRDLGAVALLVVLCACSGSVTGPSERFALRPDTATLQLNSGADFEVASSAHSGPVDNDGCSSPTVRYYLDGFSFDAQEDGLVVVTKNTGCSYHVRFTPVGSWLPRGASSGFGPRRHGNRPTRLDLAVVYRRDSTTYYWNASILVSWPE